jgi:DNA-3-methyladenine glycosylase
MHILERSFYAQNTITVAKQLLGKYLVHHYQNTQYVAKIVEVEAYLGAHDLACHASKGITKRTQTMFGPPGYAYVYMIYGMYYCMNVVTEPEGNGSAVLIRAVEPVTNILTKTKGPGLLCKAMHINKDLNNHDLLSENFYIFSEDVPDDFSIVERPRIGVDYAGIWATKNLRFYIKDNLYISKK